MNKLDKNNNVDKQKALVKKKKGRNIFFASAIFAVVAIVAISGQLQMSSEPNYIFQKGSQINGEQVSGYTVSQASEVITSKLKEQVNDISIEIIYKDKTWKFDENDFELNSSVRQVVENAYNTMQIEKLNAKGSKKNNISNTNIVNGLQNIASNNGYKVSLKNIFKNFDEKINSIISEIECEPANSEVIFTPDEKQMFTIKEGTIGIKVDREKLICDLENQFTRTKDIKVFVNTEGIEPEISKSYYENKLNLMSKFHTSLENSQEGRRFNVGLALSKFNGKVIKSGERISFNEVTGPQNAETGYKNAIIILNGKYVNGIGGGICQASTTLYNACVLANLEIDEVHKHSLPVGYVEMSLDAMVSDGYSDFIFTNNSENDIYIKTYTVGDDATVEIYGNSIPSGFTVKRVAELINKIPHNGDKVIEDVNNEYADKVLYKGEYYRVKWPKEGYEAKAYKELYKDGELVYREEIRHEKYQPVDGLVVEGTKEPPEGYVIPKSDVNIIGPQKVEQTNVNETIKQVKKENPTSFNP